MRKIKLIIVFSIFVALLSMNVAATTTNTENFENDTAGSDPAASWYTYTDEAWDYVFVNETDYRSSNHSYEVNDTDPAGLWSWFNWTGTDLTYFELYFKIDNSTHDLVVLNMAHTAGLSTNISIYGKTGAVEPYVTYSNATTTLWNNTISNNTWWKLRWDFNYTDDTVRCRLFDNSSHDNTSTNDTWLQAGLVTDIDITDSTGLNIMGVDDYAVQIWFDDFALYDAYTAPTSLDNIITSIQALVTVVVVLGLMGIVVKAFSKFKL